MSYKVLLGLLLIYLCLNNEKQIFNIKIGGFFVQIILLLINSGNTFLRLFQKKRLNTSATH